MTLLTGTPSLPRVHLPGGPKFLMQLTFKSPLHEDAAPDR